MSEKKLATSDFNLMSINTAEYGEIIKTAFQSGSNLAVFGRRGLGKTQIPHDITNTFTFSSSAKKSEKINLIYCNLSVYERPDMGGYPDMFNIMKKETGSSGNRFVEMILPKKFQPLIEGDAPCVLFLDEVDKADLSINGPLLEMVQQRQVNGTKLKNLHCCLMAGNLIAEGGKRPSLPLLDRTEAYILHSDAQLWLEWSGKSGKIHPSVTAFMSENLSELTGAVEAKEDYKDKSPRGWENVSKMLFAAEQFGWSKEIVLKKVAGSVGKQAGTKFHVYYEYYQQIMPISKKVFNGENVKSEVEGLNSNLKIVLAMTVANKLAYLMDNEKEMKHFKGIDHCGKYFSSMVDTEVAAITMRSQLGTGRVNKWGLSDNKSWSEVYSKLRHTFFGTN